MKKTIAFFMKINYWGYVPDNPPYKVWAKSQNGLRIGGGGLMFGKFFNYRNLIFGLQKNIDFSPIFFTFFSVVFFISYFFFSFKRAQKGPFLRTI